MKGLGCILYLFYTYGLSSRVDDYIMSHSEVSSSRDKAFREKVYASYDKFIEEKWLLPPSEIRFILKEGGEDYLIVHRGEIK